MNENEAVLRGTAAVKVFSIPVTWSHMEEVRTDHPSGGHTITRNTVVDRKSMEEVMVEVDLIGLARSLGDRAVHSRGGKAVEAGGLVIVRHIRRKGVKRG